MKLLFIINCIIFILGFCLIDFEAAEVIVYRNFKKLICEIKGKDSVTVQTAVSDIDGANLNIRDQTPVIIYHGCQQYYYNLSEVSGQYYRFWQLCDHTISECDVHADDNKGKCTKTMIDLPPLLNVPLQLLADVDELRIHIVRCTNESGVFRLYVNRTFSDFSDEKLTDFSVPKPELQPISIAITRMIKLKIADIDFKVSKSKCISGWHTDASNSQGFKCFVIVNGQRIEGGYKKWQCRKDEFVMEDYSGDDLCGEYVLGDYKRRTCKGQCYNLPGCSYICSKGSAPPSDMVGPIQSGPANECASSLRLCQLGNRYCKDEINSYSCTKGSFNMENCFREKKRNPKWQCPMDMSVFNKSDLLKNESDAIAYKNDIMNKFKEKTESKKEIKMMFDILNNLAPQKKNVTFNLPVEEKRNLAGFLINRFVDDYIDFSKKKNSTAFKETSITFASKKLDNLKPEVAIPVGGKDDDDDVEGQPKEFVHVKVAIPKMSANETATASLIRFKSLDPLDEDRAVKQSIEDTRSMRTRDDLSLSDVSTGDPVTFYKNSDIFAVKLDTAVPMDTTIKYKLDTKSELAPATWLFHMEHVCGVLDTTKNWTWNTADCKLVANGTESYCQCSHLSNFAMLIAITIVNHHHLRILQVLSVIGGVVNAVSLLLFIAFLLAIARDKLQVEVVNISVTLLVGTVLFLLGFVFSRNDRLCTVVAMVTQTIFLSAFMWKFIFGMRVVGSVISPSRYRDEWIKSHHWLMYIIGYGVPALIVAIFGGIYHSDYCAVANSVCWIKSSSKAFHSFLVPVCIIIAINTVGLILVAVQLYRTALTVKDTKVNKSSNVVVLVQLLVTMGLTWIPAVFAITYLAAMYIFVLCFPLQGLLLFILVVVVNKSNRDKVSDYLVSKFSTSTTQSTSDSTRKTSSQRKPSGPSKGLEETKSLMAGPEASNHGKDKGDVQVDGEGACVTIL